MGKNCVAVIDLEWLLIIQIMSWFVIPFRYKAFVIADQSFSAVSVVNLQLLYPL